jgi:hypothetical protein
MSAQGAADDMEKVGDLAVFSDFKGADIVAAIAFGWMNIRSPASGPIGSCVLCTAFFFELARLGRLCSLQSLPSLKSMLLMHFPGCLRGNGSR